MPKKKVRDVFAPRKIDGKDHYEYSSHRKKVVAERQARELRKWPSISAVRVIRESPSEFRVYVRQKPLRTIRRQVSGRKTSRITPKTPRLRR